MSRKWYYVLYILPIFLLFLSAGFSVSARQTQKVVDMADLLDESQEETLQKQFYDLAERYQCDVAIVTTDSCEGKTPQNYTEDYYEQNGYGYGSEFDGIMLMVSIGERKFHFTTMGNATDIFTDYGLEKLDDMISEKLSDGDYFEAFQKFGTLADQFITEAERGRPYDVNHTYKEPMSVWLRLLLACIAGVAVTAIVMAILASQLKSVRVRSAAQEYVREGSFRVTRQRDIFLYRTVTRVRKEKTKNGGGSSTHTTSGGRRAGGRTGSF